MELRYIILVCMFPITGACAKFSYSPAKAAARRGNPLQGGNLRGNGEKIGELLENVRGLDQKSNEDKQLKFQQVLTK